MLGGVAGLCKTTVNAQQLVSVNGVLVGVEEHKRGRGVGRTPHWLLGS